MWYVIQVAGGREEDTAALIRGQIPHGVMEECFIPRKERVKKFHGRWRCVEEILFPGYVFTATRQPEALFLSLKRVTRLTKLLRSDREIDYFCPLSREEEALIRSIGDPRHVTRLSRLQIRDNREEGGGGQNGRGWKAAGPGREILVLSGPLKNQEGRIVSCNLHKREVTVRLPFMGQETEVRMGIELVGEKKENAAFRKSVPKEANEKI